MDRSPVTGPTRMILGALLMLGVLTVVMVAVGEGWIVMRRV